MNLLSGAHLAVLSAAAAGFLYLGKQWRFFLRACQVLSIVAVAAPLAWLFQQGYITHACPLVSPWGVLMTFTGIGIVGAWAASWRYQSPRILIAVLALLSLALIVAMAGFPPPGHSPLPKSVILPFHIFMVTVGIVAMTLAFVAGLLIILRSRDLKTAAGFDQDQAHWPSLTALDRLFVRGLGLGPLFLMAGIFLGVESRPGWVLPESWWYDPKVILTSASLLLYAAVWGLRRKQGFTTPMVVGLSSLGFVLIFIGLLASSLFTLGFHKF